MQSRVRTLLGLGASLLALVSCEAGTLDHPDQEALEELASRWVESVDAHEPSFVDLLSRSGRSYYPKIRRYALHADARTLQELEPVDQLQAMFLRLMLDPMELAAMDEAELLRFAERQGFIGTSLRAGDALGEIVVEGNEAHGRLYRSGHPDRPSRTRQYFAREDGRWRVELRGELERMRSDFEAFVARSELADAEAAFFILEMRLMRKVTPEDFDPPLTPTAGREHAEKRPAPGPLARPVLRLVSTRQPLDSNHPLAATIEDRVESLRYLLEPGDALPNHPSFRLIEVRPESVVLSTDEGEIDLALEHGWTLGDRQRRPARATGRSLVDLARQGSEREGLMAQWRNVGLRDRPLLLQQASLTPVLTESDGAERSMRGLRVSQIVETSFWHQLGLQPGDLLTEMNGRPVDSMAAWQNVLLVAQNDLDITIRIERAGDGMAFRTRTIPPR